MYFLYPIIIIILLLTPASAANEKSLNALRAGDFKAAATNAETKTMRKLATYMGLLENPEGYELADFVGFIRDNSKWPFAQIIRANSARANMKNTSPARIIAWFTKCPPKSEIGAKKFLAAMEKSGHIDKISINHIWIMNDLDLKKYKNFLTYQSHKTRVAWLLESNKLDLAKQMLPYLNKNDALLLKAKLALRNNSVIPLPQALANDKGYLFEKLKFYKTSDDIEGCKILLKHPGVNKWNGLRLYFAREALHNNKPQLAYDVITKHKATEPQDIADAEWFAGWIALRFLHKPALALPHFKAMQQIVGMPQSVAKAHFWLAQTYNAMDGAGSAEHLKKGAKYAATFYGQMCAKELGIEPKMVFRNIKQAKPPKPNKSELIQAIYFLKAAGMKDKIPPFLYILGKNIKSDSERAEFIQLVKAVFPEYTVRAIKQICGNNHYIYKDAYPVLGTDKLVMAIIRQESEFDGNQISYAGAMGLMQLMPATAEMYSKKLQMTYNKNHLTSNAEYNIAVGTAYLQDKLNEFPGSIVPPIASYNAGHKPVYKWIDRNGPLKDNEVETIDWVDWIEKISYGQTRDYVQKVWSNLKVYEQLLG